MDNLGEESVPENGSRNDIIPLPKRLSRDLFGGRSVVTIHSGWTHIVAMLGE